MRVFAVSDLHVDYESNRKFVSGLSDYDYRDDVLLVAGDVTHCLDQFASAFHEVTKKYRAVFLCREIMTFGCDEMKRQIPGKNSGSYGNCVGC